MCRASVADAQTALEQGSGSLAELHDELDGFAVHRIISGVSAFARFSSTAYGT